MNPFRRKYVKPQEPIEIKEFRVRDGNMLIVCRTDGQTFVKAHLPQNVCERERMQLRMAGWPIKTHSLDHLFGLSVLVEGDSFQMFKGVRIAIRNLKSKIEGILLSCEKKAVSKLRHWIRSGKVFRSFPKKPSRIKSEIGTQGKRPLVEGEAKESPNPLPRHCFPASFPDGVQISSGDSKF